MSKVHITEKGTHLPLLNLKGKDYMLIAHRMVWFREVHPMGKMKTEVIQLTDTMAIMKATISILNANGDYVEVSTAVKREDAKHFPDFLEKSETGSLGRALSLAGFGTSFSLPELDEGDRLADAPLESAKKTPPITMPGAGEILVPGTDPEVTKELAKDVAKKVSSFRKNKPVPTVTKEMEEEWS